MGLGVEFYRRLGAAGRGGTVPGFQAEATGLVPVPSPRGLLPR